MLVTRNPSPKRINTLLISSMIFMLKAYITPITNKIPEKTYTTFDHFLLLIQLSLQAPSLLKILEQTLL